MTLALKMADARYDGYEEGFAEGREAGLQVGLQQGLEQGLERGAYEKALETARNLLAMGLSPEQISQAPKLPPETISHLAAAGDMINSGLF